MNLIIKIVLGILLLLCYIPGYYFFYEEIGKSDYNLTSISIGLFCTIFGLWGHFVLIFENSHIYLKISEYVYIAFFYIKTFVAILLFPFAIYLFYLGFFAKSDHFLSKDLILIHGTLREKPIFESHSKGSDDLFINLNEYKNYLFEPQYASFIHYKTNFEQNSKVGDLITIGVLKDDYEKSIKKSKVKTYFEEHINSKLITIYYVQKKDQIYYSTSIHNQLDMEDNRFSFIYVIFGVLAIIFSIYNISIAVIFFFFSDSDEITTKN